MGKTFDAIDERLEAFLRDQRLLAAFLRQAPSPRGQMSPLLTPR
jgi:hypothetical protein